MKIAEQDALKAIEIYDELVYRFLESIRGAPYWASPYHETFARISIDDQRATLIWPESDSSYDSCRIEEQKVAIPLELLFLNEEKFATWKAEERRKYDQKVERNSAHARASKQAEERKLYEQLKKKFEGSQNG